MSEAGVTGIGASEDMPRQFAEFRRAENSPSFCVFRIVDDALHVAHTERAASPDAPFEDNITALRSYLQGEERANQACYVLVNKGGDVSGTFVMITYIPDGCSAREKMVYSGTASALRSLVGSSVSRSLQRCDLESITAEELSHVSSSSDLYTERERQLREESKASAEIITTSSTELSVGASTIAFALHPNTESALKEFGSRLGVGEPSHNLLSMWVDDSEVLQSQELQSAGPEELPAFFPSDRAQFLLVRYVHTFEGDVQSPVVFIMAVPDHIGVREKMVATSAKRSVATTLAPFAEIALEMQANSSDELSPDSISGRLHKSAQHREASRLQTGLVGSRAKPKARGRGPAPRLAPPPLPAAP